MFSVYYVRPTLRWQNTVSLLASYYFYGWWDYRFCSLLFITSALDYWLGARIASAKRPAARRMLLLLSLIGSLGLLGFFKYYNFFIVSLVTALNTVGVRINTSLLNVILPVGISFYTFQSLSYTIDIYRGHNAVQNSFRWSLNREILWGKRRHVSPFPEQVGHPDGRMLSKSSSS